MLTVVSGNFVRSRQIKNQVQHCRWIIFTCAGFC